MVNQDHLNSVIQFALDRTEQGNTVACITAQRALPYIVNTEQLESYQGPMASSFLPRNCCRCWSSSIGVAFPLHCCCSSSSSLLCCCSLKIHLTPCQQLGQCCFNPSQSGTHLQESESEDKKVKSKSCLIPTSAPASSSSLSLATTNVLAASRMSFLTWTDKKLHPCHCNHYPFHRHPCGNCNHLQSWHRSVSWSHLHSLSVRVPAS